MNSTTARILDEPWGIELRDGKFHPCIISQHAAENFSRMVNNRLISEGGWVKGEIVGEVLPAILVVSCPCANGRVGGPILAKLMNDAMPEGVPSFAWTEADWSRAHDAFMAQVRRWGEEARVDYEGMLKEGGDYLLRKAAERSLKH